jgi:hypothetical protein
VDTVESADPPPALGGFYGMAYDAERDEFALIAGRHSVERFHDDAWHLSLDPAAPGRTTWVFDRDAAAGADRVQVEFSGDGAPSLEVATSTDTGTWSEPASDARFARVAVGFPPVAQDAAAPLRVRRVALANGSAPCAGRAGCIERTLPRYAAPSARPM